MLTAKFDKVQVIWDLWPGQLPMLRTEDQNEISNNVLFLTLRYGKHESRFSGLDYYYVQEDSNGWEIIVWVDPRNPWHNKEVPARRYFFSKTSDEIIDEVLPEIPVLVGVHEGVMIADNIWETLR